MITPDSSATTLYSLVGFAAGAAAGSAAGAAAGSAAAGAAGAGAAASCAAGFAPHPTAATTMQRTSSKAKIFFINGFLLKRIMIISGCIRINPMECRNNPETYKEVSHMIIDIEILTNHEHNHNPMASFL